MIFFVSLAFLSSSSSQEISVWESCQALMWVGQSWCYHTKTPMRNVLCSLPPDFKCPCRDGCKWVLLSPVKSIYLGLKKFFGTQRSSKIPLKLYTLIYSTISILKQSSRGKVNLGQELYLNLVFLGQVYPRVWLTLGHSMISFLPQFQFQDCFCWKTQRSILWLPPVCLVHLRLLLQREDVLHCAFCKGLFWNIFQNWFPLAVKES